MDLNFKEKRKKVMWKYAHIVLMAMLWATLAGCSNTDSENVSTSGLQAEIEVKAPGNGSTDIRVDLSVGSGGVLGTSVELNSGDTLTASVGTTTKTLSKDKFLGNVSYETRFDVDDANALFTVSLNRTNDESAKNSRVTLPPPFDMTVQPTEVSGTGASEVTLTWSPNSQSDDMQLEADSSCSESVGGETVVSFFYKTIQVNDDGELSFSIASLIEGEEDLSQYNRGCGIELSLVRVRSGQLDPAFGEGGTIKAFQVRKETLSFTP